MTKWMNIAIAEIGVKEIPGKEHSTRVLDYHSATGLGAKDDETPWCGSFVAWVFKQAGIDYADVWASAAGARQWLRWGQPLKSPIHGALMVLSRGASATAGHNTFFVDWVDEEKGIFNGLGGNQSNSVNVSRYRMSDVLEGGIRWPKEVAIPVAEQPLGKSGVVRWSTAGLVGFFTLIGDNISTILDSFTRADAEFSKGTMLSAIAAALILVALIGVIHSRAKGRKDEKKIQHGDS